MQKVKVVLLTSIVTTVVGLLFKKFEIPGAGLVLAIGYSISIILYSNFYILHPSKKVNEITIAISMILLPTILFALIQNREIFYVLKGTLFWIVFIIILQFFRGKIDITNKSNY